MIRLLQPMPGGLRCIIGVTTQDHAKQVHGQAQVLDLSDVDARVVEILIVWKSTQSELVRELTEAGLVGPETEITKGQPE